MRYSRRGQRYNIEKLTISSTLGYYDVVGVKKKWTETGGNQDLDVGTTRKRHQDPSRRERKEAKKCMIIRQTR